MSIKIELTTEILKKVIVSNIIYAEIAEPGAMGNSGGVIIYILHNKQLIRYEASFFSDKKLYKAVKPKLFKHQNILGFDDVKPSEVFFEYYYGGFGNHVIMNENFPLIQKKDLFIYIHKSKEYEITCSVFGVFSSIVDAKK